MVTRELDGLVLRSDTLEQAVVDLGRYGQDVVERSAGRHHGRDSATAKVGCAYREGDPREICAFQVNSAVRVVAPILLPPMRVRAFMARSDERAHLGVDVQGDATDVVNGTSPDG